MLPDRNLPKIPAIGLEGTIFYGDPHGRWDPLLRALEPSIHTVIILGDLAEAKRHPEQVEGARVALAEITARGVDWRMISGNHDSETTAICDLVYQEFEERLLDGNVFPIGASGPVIAGLGGVVREKIWDGVNPPKFYVPEDLIQVTPRSTRHHQGLPCKHFSTIFRSTVDRLAGQHADVLVSHEAPSCHEHGFSFIDDLARSMGAGLIVHGHHHVSYEAQLQDGTRVKGLGEAEVWRPTAVAGI